MKIIFLDVDGVLRTNSEHMRPTQRLSDRTIWSYNPECIAALNYVVTATQARLVVSSTWREWGMAKLCSIFADWGVRQAPYSLTPRSIRDPWSVEHCWGERGDEIQWWIALHQERDREPIEQFVIFDDENDVGLLLPCLLQTVPDIGLTWENAQEAIVLLQTKEIAL